MRAQLCGLETAVAAFSPLRPSYFPSTAMEMLQCLRSRFFCVQSLLRDYEDVHEVLRAKNYRGFRQAGRVGRLGWRAGGCYGSGEMVPDTGNILSWF